MTKLEQYQRSILATLLNEPDRFDGFVQLCDMVKWEEPYDKVYAEMKAGSRSIYLLAERTKLPNKFFIGLVESPKEPFLTDLIAYCADITNRNLIINDLNELILSAPDMNQLSSDLNAIVGRLSSLYRVTSYDMEKLNLEQNNAVERQKSGGVTSLKCGLPTLQKHLMGWHPGHLTVIGGNSSAGKTAFVLTCMREVTQANNCKTAIVSYEMTPREIHARLLAQVCEIQPRDILYNQLTDEQFKKFHKGLGILENLPMVIEKPEDSEIDTLISKIRFLVSRDVKWIAIDYLQLLRDKNIRDRYTSIGSIARRLKNISIELDVSIVVLSQLNRDNFKSSDKRPTLASLRDSGEIEEAADEVILLFREEYFLKPEEITEEIKGVVEVDFAKGRSTGIGMSKMKYEKEYTRFSEATNNRELRDYTEPVRRMEPDTGF